jgi:hypothetical protein
LIGIESSKDLDLQRFWEVYSTIEKYSYDINHINKEDLVD